ncbi:esterase [Skermanella stibiiresistens SB22]|uniref:Esterase n=1 Tax=Skermanella stibiiresistens SB22 TaxID=1385369 RepID=W9GYC5_9PROT|nr:alpha/beta fold hydrolase [Skermanella stibiiresistens]EWY36483.1 esterase [Skermanella stibiiresistens SB22]
MGMTLTGFEAGEGEPLVVLHGLFGSARNWNTVAKRLGDSHRVHALDMRNHGGSPWSSDMGYADMAEDVEDYIEGRHLGPVSLLGHSMGGKAAMVVALTRPDLVDKLIVADIAPVTYRHTLMPYVEAMRAVDLSGVGRRGEVDTQLAASIPEAPIRGFLLQNLVAENGAFSWRINLEALGDRMDELTAFPTADLAGLRFDKPTLFLAGERSDYVRPSAHDEIKRLFPNSRVETLANAGHWLHAEQPDRFVDSVLAFLDE